MSQINRQIDARKLLVSEYQSVLSTLSVDVPGYPFGSVVPYCLTRQGLPLILISNIAQHTKNILADSRVSLIVSTRHAADQQASARLTIVGDAQAVEQELGDVAWRYYSFFPQARDYHKTHGFDFFVIKPSKFRFIGGFGDIGWIEQDRLLLANPFSLEDEQRIVNHMNDDHADSLKKYCHSNGIACAENDEVVMVGIDAEGLHLAIASVIYRIHFSEPVADAMEARKMLVAMSQQAA